MEMSLGLGASDSLNGYVEDLGKALIPSCIMCDMKIPIYKTLEG